MDMTTGMDVVIGIGMGMSTCTGIGTGDRVDVVLG